jgi:RHS repeat-associated protein
MGGGIGSILYSDRTMVSGGIEEVFAYNPAVGHVVGLTNAAGATAETNQYDAFGNIVGTSGTSKNNRLANTKERDVNVAGVLTLDDHGMRYYNPVTGRYISADPMGFVDGLDKYLYVHNNPINDIDPLGLFGGDHQCDDGGGGGSSDSGSSSDNSGSNNGTTSQNPEGQKIPNWKKQFSLDAFLKDNNAGTAFDDPLGNAMLGLHTFENEISRAVNAAENGDSPTALVLGDASGINDIIDNYRQTDRLSGQSLNEDEASARGYGGFARLISIAGGPCLGELNALGEGSMLSRPGIYLRNLSDAPVGNLVPETVDNAAYHPYSRDFFPSTPTAADRTAIGGSPDHVPAIVQRWYNGDPSVGERPLIFATPSERAASARDRSRMVPSTKNAQNSQGGTLSNWSKQMKRVWFDNH